MPPLEPSDSTPEPPVRLAVDNVPDPSQYALSGVSLDDLNMNLRVEVRYDFLSSTADHYDSSRLLFLCHRLIYGIHIPFAKQQAILVGDLSSAIVHPFYVYFANLSGCVFYQERKGHQFLSCVESAHLQSTLDALGTMVEENDPFTMAQANFLMGMAYGHIKDISSAKK